MKKILFLVLFIAICIAWLTPAKADIAVPNTHYVKRCVKIASLGEYPEIILVGNPTGPMSGNPYIINSDKCLQEMYQFSSLSIYWVNKGYYDIHGLQDLEKNDEKKISNANFHLITSSIDPSGRKVDNSNKITSENITYNLTKSSSGEYSLTKGLSTNNLMYSPLMIIYYIIGIPVFGLILLIILIILRRKAKNAVSLSSNNDNN